MNADFVLGQTDPISESLDLDANNAIVNPTTNKVYFTSYDNDAVYVVNGSSNIILKTIPLEDLGEELAVNNETNRIYVQSRKMDSIYIIDGFKDEIIDSINASSSHEIRVNPLNNMMYILDSERVYELNLTSNKEGRSATVESAAYNLEIDPITNLIYVANNENGTVSIINASDFKNIGNVSVARSPYDMAINPFTNKIYTINEGVDRLSIIDANNQNKVKNIILNSSFYSEEPNLIVDTETELIYISNGDGDTITVIDGREDNLLDTFPAGIYPTNLALNPTNNMVYVISLADTVHVINGSRDSLYDVSVSARDTDTEPGIKVDDNPIDIAVNPFTNTIYSISSFSNEISMIDGRTDRIINTISLDEVPSAIDINPLTNLIYTFSNSTVYVVDPVQNATVYNFSLSEPIDSLSVDSVENEIYLHDGLDTLHIFDGYSSQEESNLTNVNNFINNLPGEFIYSTPSAYGEVLTIDKYRPNITIDDGVDKLVYNPITSLTYALTSKTIYVTDFETNSTLNKIPVEIFSSDIAVNPQTNMVYVSDNLHNHVQIINGTTHRTVDYVGVGKSPESIALNPQTNMLYVANGDSNTVSAVNGYTNKVTATVMFNTNPPNSGSIECQGHHVSLNQTGRYDIGTECKAIANTGYEFTS